MNDLTAKQEAARPYPRHCAQCGNDVVYSACISYDAAVKHDGKVHQFRIPSLVLDKCQSCGEEYFTNSTDEQISAALRQLLGLLQPAEIREQLAQLGITQRAFAEHLRVAPETV